MKRLEPGFFENGKKKIAFNLLARRVGQLTSGSGALVKIRGSSGDGRVTMTYAGIAIHCSKREKRRQLNQDGKKEG